MRRPAPAAGRRPGYHNHRRHGQPPARTIGPGPTPPTRTSPRRGRSYCPVPAAPRTSTAPSEAEIRAQLETNLLGALWVAQAALPYLRRQGSGHIVQVSSIGGISALPNAGACHASQWALEGLSQSLAAEVSGFGVKVTLVVPTGYTMDWVGSSASKG
jgi:NAD(P)-dependent dehydrogenase (short-subunit alcohol dehydrogenase family)